MKYCKDCRHFWNEDAELSARCTHPEALVQDPLYGPFTVPARALREVGGTCGMDAKLFEPADAATAIGRAG